VLYALTPPAPLDASQVARRGLLVLGQTSAIWGALQHGQLWLPALHPFAQTWSLAIEWYFYLLWPLVVLAARRRGMTARLVMRISVVAAVVLYLGSLLLSDFWFYFGPPARFAELLVGCALALAFQAYGPPTRRWRGATAASVVSLAALAAYTLFAPSALSPVSRYLGVPMTVLATVVLIHCGYSNPSGPVQRLLSHRWLAAIGRYSYSLYLWHVVPMLLLAGNWLHLPIPLLALVAVTASGLLTFLSYQLLERPFLRARSDVLRQATSEPSTAPRAASAP
jgi:peptidoglycan/LPS O-acetylase OafA/YrhL